MSEVKSKSTLYKRQSLAYRLIAAVVAIACVVAIFLPYTFFGSTADGLTTTELKLYKLAELLPDAPYKFLRFIPMFTNPKGVLGLATGLVGYVFVAFLALAFIAAILSLILGKKGELPLTVALLLYTWGAALYMTAVVSVSCYLPMKIIFDVSSIVLAAIGTLAYVVFLQVKLGKKLCILNSLRFLLTLGFTVCLLLALAFDYTLVRKLLSKSVFYKILLVAATALTIANVIFASVRAARKHAFAADFLNSLMELAIAGVLIALSLISSVLSLPLLVFSSIAAAISVALLVLTFIGLHASKQKATAKTKPAAKKNPAPVAPVDPEPVAPVEPEPVAPAEADFFADKQSDSFIATLDVDERNQFAALYLSPSENSMPEIPAYQINGDNKVFFEMVFITLGEYRESIPDGLLCKMYQHVCANYPQAEIDA